MATIVEHAPSLPSRTSTPPPPHLTLNTSARGSPAAVPNKHIPICSPGRAPAQGLNTPPASPPTKSSPLLCSSSSFKSLDQFPKLLDSPPVYSIEASTLAEAIDQQATTPLPDPAEVFPWLHGLHPENSIQLAFFAPRKKSPLRKVPSCLHGLTLVKAGGDLSKAKLKGAIAPNELLQPTDQKSNSLKPSEFLETDPKSGFSVRNFQIQACKIATVSDVIIYRDHETKQEELVQLAKNIALAQKAWQEKSRDPERDSTLYNTFVLSEPFETFETKYPELVAIDSEGNMTGNVVDLFYCERAEMAAMTQASEIAPNVYLGPTPDPTITAACTPQSDVTFDVFIEASDLAQMPDTLTLNELRNALDAPDKPTVHFEVPSSGSILPPTWSHAEVDGLMNLCRWIWDVSHEQEKTASESTNNTPSAEVDADGDTDMQPEPPSPSTSAAKKVLIHCADGYTETTLLGITYFMYAHGFRACEAWVKLHREKQRNFFAYPTDVGLLSSIQLRILMESPAGRWNPQDVPRILQSNPDPNWMSKLDGSLPSRVLPWMYLGNLSHANNPDLLEELGIRRIVSVGERVNWVKAVDEGCSIEPDRHISDGFEFFVVDNVQDNGIDALGVHLERCLEFIEQGKQDGIATLVHCRVGVSRSATICIAEVMKELGLSFARAYCYVRARRLNVIIQPHLRFTYELLKWEEELNVRRGESLRRELEWATVAREIAAMNKPYTRS